MSRDRDPGALQTNAADARQVAHGHRASRDRYEATRAAYRETLDTVAGRRVLWDLLTRAGIYQSVMVDGRPEVTFYKAGRQDFGHELLALLLDVDEGLYLRMEGEARLEMAREARANVAVRTPPTTEDEAT